MAGTSLAVVALSELRNGQEAECFALLARKEMGTDKNGNPFVRCYFRDRRVTLVAPLWASDGIRVQAEAWAEGEAYRIHVRGETKPSYGLQLKLYDARPVRPEDAADGLDYAELVESTSRPPEQMFQTIHDLIDKYIDEPHLNQLVRQILSDNAAEFKRMQAAQTMHHSITGGLLEHVWSLTRICAFLADHYAKYYDELNPPLNRGIVIAVAILHDIGKLRELEYHPVEAKYTKLGCLVGHVVMGRDMVREAALKIEGFPEETLVQLDHAILAHHGKREFGAPILPLTIEAILFSMADDLDAKMNSAVRARLRSTTSDEFTDKVYNLDNRRIYKGIPLERPAGSDVVPEA